MAPDNYAVDVTALAKATGQLPASPPPPAAPLTLPIDHDGSDSEANDDTDAGKVKKKGKGGTGEFRLDLVGAPTEDSLCRKRTWQRRNTTWATLSSTIQSSPSTSVRRFAQTKQQGFYVSSGEVALVKDK